MWVMTQRGAWYIIHYIDDFLTVGALGSNECDRIMHEIDSRDMELRLPGEKLVHITTKELVPIVLETALWGKEWQGQAVQIWCDNAAVVSVINQGSSRDKQAMHLTRCLAFIKAKFELELVAAHISGANNTKADALSRNKLSLFHCLHPQTNSKPTNIREALLDLLLVSKPDWMSQHWENLWTSIFLTVSRQQQGGHMMQLRRDMQVSAKQVEPNPSWHQNRCCVCLYHTWLMISYVTQQLDAT